MKRILYLKSSLFAGDGVSNRLSEDLVDGLVNANPGSQVTVLDLAVEPLPHLDSAEFTAWTTGKDERTDAQAALTGLSDQLIAQLRAHDTLVLAVPMYNLGIPSTLKAWIDRVARAGETFRYTPNGPEGLLQGIETYLVFSRGGIYRDSPLDTQTGYLKNILGLMGIDDIRTVYAEGLAMGDTQRSESIEQARDLVRALVTAETEVNHVAA